uniref:Uncharacterized protein n=1 Tax=Octopus bimaculoides TaxID=37653 RepID=A0A0L8FGV9_OCTBM
MIAPVIPQDIPDPTTYVHRLRAHMSQLPPNPPRPQETDTYVPTDINQWTHVFVRNDGIPAQIRPPYSDPYKVLQKREKYFVIDVNGKQNTVSISRLKKAIMEPDTAPPSSSPLTTHRSDITASAFPHLYIKVSTTPSHKKRQKSSLAGEICTSLLYLKKNKTPHVSDSYTSIFTPVNNYTNEHLHERTLIQFNSYSQTNKEKMFLILLAIMHEINIYLCTIYSLCMPCDYVLYLILLLLHLLYICHLITL